MQAVQDLCCGFVTGEEVKGAVAEAADLQEAGGGVFSRFRRSCVLRVAGLVEARQAICRSLEAAGVEFIEENGGGAGVRLRKAIERGGSK